ncbi:hypothetical protein CCR75_002586 [Bremia lactucae]|uniref:Uncharacterized protein n=1 Tax=Bremia lactucae TaxID=4779 RepID=A0A976IL87_BRELC|nr:hypothetical protein CCR75_002586 [Bremia lactucae]
MIRVEMPSIRGLAFIKATSSMTITMKASKVAVGIRGAAVEMIRHWIRIFSIASCHGKFKCAVHGVMVREVNERHLDIAFRRGPIGNKVFDLIYVRGKRWIGCSLATQADSTDSSTLSRLHDEIDAKTYSWQRADYKSFVWQGTDKRHDPLETT